jgi:polyhydroxybutyrate depolymerase
VGDGDRRGVTVLVVVIAVKTLVLIREGRFLPQREPAPPSLVSDVPRSSGPGSWQSGPMADDSSKVAGELTVRGLARRFTLYVPRERAVAAPRPLVLVLHGNFPEEGVGSRLMRSATTFDREADTRGWVIAYPDGLRGSWADGRGVTAAEEAGADDVAFLRALIETAAERHGTAPDRTVVAGVSNGAFMAHRLAAVAGDRVAVVAAVAGTLPVATASLEVDHAVSALLIHGDADPIAPIGGGYSRHRGPNGELRGRTLSLGESAAFWQGVDRCDAGTSTRSEMASTARVSVAGWGGGVGATRVEAWTVAGGGHDWPGAPGRPGPGGAEESAFDAAVEICRFAAPLLRSADERRL